MNRHTREQGLLSQIRELRNTVDALPDAVVLLDSDQRILWANPAAGTLLGIHKRRDRGRRLDEIAIGASLGKWLDSKQHETSFDFVASSDPERHLSVTLLPVGANRHCLLARDTSRLSRLEQVRRDFIANVSHELRTPLTVIHGYLELFDPADIPELAPALREMRAQSQRMRQIVEDLLTLSRLETQHEPDDEHVAMADMLASLHKEARALSQGKHRIEVHDNADLDLVGSHRDLHSAFSNLVSNAVRYTPEGGRIDICWKAVPEGARFEVLDTGHGIPSEHLGRLSERFYRVSSSRSRDKGGTGLGLSIVKHVLNLHQARLIIESEHGEGSMFACAFDSARIRPRSRAMED